MSSLKITCACEMATLVTNIIYRQHFKTFFLQVIGVGLLKAFELPLSP